MVKKTKPTVSSGRDRYITGPISMTERQVIYDLLDTHTDAQISEITQRSPAQILKMRGQAVVNKVQDKNTTSITILHAKHYWSKIRSQLLDDEVNFFEQEWAAYNLQFQDLVHTDELTMIDTIMLTIQINRLLIQHKESLEEIARIKVLLENEVKKQPDDQDMLMIKSLRDTVTSLQMVLQNITKQVESHQNVKDRKFSQLKVTREQRFKRIEESKKNFFELFKMLDEHDSRMKENRTLSLVRDSAEKIKREWMEPSEFPDGSVDSILLSEDTVEYLEGKEDED